ncbi:hypothetical protein PoB_006394700 [Plakobranchus ocellatus]|uniref:Uncharacterized protein n=1 Tax=Plakobranchus ocellatus TaxID=259542 RepID=A0AAV4CZT1_9GAST|nr:hypothetical protein PoB_006394700 [Plakobranchus ocellatus]
MLKQIEPSQTFATESSAEKSLHSRKTLGESGSGTFPLQKTQVSLDSKYTSKFSEVSMLQDTTTSTFIDQFKSSFLQIRYRLLPPIKFMATRLCSVWQKVPAVTIRPMETMQFLV